LLGGNEALVAGQQAAVFQRTLSVEQASAEEVLVEKTKGRPEGKGGRQLLQGAAAYQLGTCQQSPDEGASLTRFGD